MEVGGDGQPPRVAAVAEAPVPKAVAVAEGVKECRGLVDEIRTLRDGERKGWFVAKKICEANDDWADERVRFAANIGKEHLEVEEELGRGGFGVVVKARRSTGDLVAVKSAAGSQRDAQLTEMAVLARLKPHPNVVDCSALDDANPAQLQIVMEYCDAGDMVGVAADKTLLGDVEKTRLFHDFASGLAHLHSHGFVHCDLKPANLLLKTGADGLLTGKIADFGLALVEGETRRNRGTLGFLPQEVLFNSGPARQSQDVFSFAATMWILLVKRQHRISNMFCCGLVINAEEKAIAASLKGKPVAQRLAFMKLLTLRVMHDEDAMAKLLRPDLFEIELAAHHLLLPMMANMLVRDADRRPTTSQVMAVLDVVHRDLLAGAGGARVELVDTRPTASLPTSAPVTDITTRNPAAHVPSRTGGGGGVGLVPEAGVQEAAGAGARPTRVVMQASHRPPAVERVKYEEPTIPTYSVPALRAGSGRVPVPAAIRMEAGDPVVGHERANSFVTASGGRGGGGCITPMAGIGQANTGGPTIPISREVGGDIAPSVRRPGWGETGYAGSRPVPPGKYGAGYSGNRVTETGFRDQSRFKPCHGTRPSPHPAPSRHIHVLERPTQTAVPAYATEWNAYEHGSASARTASFFHAKATAPPEHGVRFCSEETMPPPDAGSGGVPSYFTSARDRRGCEARGTPDVVAMPSGATGTTSGTAAITPPPGFFGPPKTGRNDNGSRSGLGTDSSGSIENGRRRHRGRRSEHRGLRQEVATGSTMRARRSGRAGGGMWDWHDFHREPFRGFGHGHQYPEGHPGGAGLPRMMQAGNGVSFRLPESSSCWLQQRRVDLATGVY